VSDFSKPRLCTTRAAWHANRILDLVTYCNREKIPFVEFDDFSKILATVKSIVDGRTTIDAVQQ
jgi:2-hydroxy-3-keto-5-methylthiopentenyl-1-phosphate phosphatase